MVTVVVVVVKGVVVVVVLLVVVVVVVAQGIAYAPYRVRIGVYGFLIGVYG